MFLMIDNYDSFVYNLVRYMREIGEEIVIKRNDKMTLEEIASLNPEGIILSPGPKRPEDAGISEAVVRKFAGEIPILGICLGHQIIGHVYGAKIIEGKKPMHGKVSAIDHVEQGLYKNIAMPFNGTRYHSLIIESESLPDIFQVTSQTEDGTIMGITHKKLFLDGVQFHPEAELTDYGHELLKNFVRKCRESGLDNDAD